MSLTSLLLSHTAQQIKEVELHLENIVSSTRPVPSISSLSIGQGCVARYAEDGEWYRAVVVKKSANTAKVCQFL